MPRLSRIFVLALSLGVGAGCSCSSGSDLRVVPSVLPPGNVGAAYSAAISATGGQAPVTLSVSQGALPAGVTLSEAGALSGTPTASGSFRFTVSAQDAAGATATSGFTLEILSNAPPRIATATLPDGLTGVAYSVALQVDGGQGPFQWSVVSGALPSGLSVSSGALSGSPASPGSFSFELEVDDARGQSDRKALTLTVRAPLAIATSALPDGYTDAPYSLALQASGGQAPLSWSLSGGALPDGLALSSSGLIAGMPAIRGRWAPTLLVADAAGQTASVSLFVSVYEPPSVATSNLPDGSLGAAYASAIATSGGKAPFSFSIGTGALPPGLSLDGASISGTPTAPGPASFSIEVTDANGRTAVRFFSVTIFSGLAVTTSRLADGYTGVAYAEQLSAAAGSAPYAWTSSALPAGLALSASGELSGTPASAGTLTVTFTATDALSQTASRDLALAIYSPPSVATAALPDGYAGESYSQPLQANGGKSPLTWTLPSGALPAGFVLSSAGVVSGSPASASSASFSAVITDANGVSSAPRSVSLAVLPALSVGTASLADGYVGQAYSQQLAASGGKAPYSWTRLSGSLPSGLALSGSGAITGTPSQATAASFAVQVTDANGHTATSTLLLSTYAPVAIQTASLPDAYSNAAYSASLSATGGKAPITWSVAVGSLPSGLSLSSSGAITGTPGTYAASSTFTARATDKNGTSADRQLTISVYSLPAITTASLPGGSVGTSYDQTIAETGGRSPLTWSIASGALPAGLTLDSSAGRIFGTPTANGTASFTLQVADFNGRAAQKALSILVGTPGPALLSVANWNIDWFGDPANGPSNDTLQFLNVRGVIADAGFDLWGLEEVVDAGSFDQLISQLPGYTGFLANDTRYVDGGTSYYSPTEQKVGVLFNTSKLTYVGAQVILTSFNSDFAGRPPLRVDFRANVDGGQRDLTVIVLHMKAFADQAAYNERYAAGLDLKSYLDTYLPTQTALVIGDWNDDVDQSITKDGGVYLDTPYRALVNDSADYTYVTAPLSAAGVRSTVSNSGFIDHQLATNEAAALLYSPAELVRPDLWAVPITSYGGSTVSDHYPVVSRYNLQ